MEERVPTIQKKHWNYHKPRLSAVEIYKVEDKLDEEKTDKCEVPKPVQGYVYEWEKTPIDERVARADRRSHMMCKLQDMEPNMTN